MQFLNVGLCVDLGAESRPEQADKMNSTRFFDLANLLTLIGLSAAVVCAVLAMKGFVAYAVVALMISGLCDLFDGLVARRLNRDELQREFGGHLDTVVDACSFGFAPVVLMHSAGMTSIPHTAVLVTFVCCTVWRLAYFETVGLTSDGSTRYYSGLPTTYVALVLPLAFLPGFFDGDWLAISLTVAAVGLALAMVSSISIRKPGGVSYVFFLLLAVIMGVGFIWFADRLQS